MTKKKRITPKRLVQIRLNEAMQSFEQFFEHYGISESQRNEMIEKLNQSDKPYSKQALGIFLKMYILINGCIEEFEQNENPAGLHYFDCETICPWKGDLDVAEDPCEDEINQNLALAISVAHRTCNILRIAAPYHLANRIVHRSMNAKPGAAF